MLPGFNHNIRHRGEVFHVQTEDGGHASPFVTTLLYRGGAIISSLKSPYPDLDESPDSRALLMEYMKSQHKGMLRRLTGGEFDAELRRRGILGAEAAQDAIDLQTLVLAYLKV